MKLQKECREYRVWYITKNTVRARECAREQRPLGFCGIASRKSAAERDTIFIHVNVAPMYDEIRRKTPKSTRQIRDCWRDRARHPQNKIKRIYSFGRRVGEREGRGGGEGERNPFENGPITSAARDFTIDIYERSHVPKWKFTRPIMRSIMSLFVRKLIDARR